MSCKQRTTLKLSVRIPLPAGMPQREAVELIKNHLAELSAREYGGFLIHEILVKLEGKETVYL